MKDAYGHRYRVMIRDKYGAKEYGEWQNAGSYATRADAVDAMRIFKGGGYTAKEVKISPVRSNPSRRPATKLQRMVNASKRATKKRVAVALKKFLHQTNPGAKLAGAKIQKLAGGVIKITPIRANAASGGAWAVKNGWHPPTGAFSRKSDAAAMARQMRAANQQAGIKGAVKVVRVAG